MSEMSSEKARRVYHRMRFLLSFMFSLLKCPGYFVDTNLGLDGCSETNKQEANAVEEHD